MAGGFSGNQVRRAVISKSDRWAQSRIFGTEYCTEALRVVRPRDCILSVSLMIKPYFPGWRLCRAFATPSQSSTVRVCGQAVPATHTSVSSRLVLPALPECALWNFVLLGAWEGHNTAGRQVRSHEGGWGGVAVCVSECSAPGLSGSQVSRQVSGHNGCRRTEDIC